MATLAHPQQLRRWPLGGLYALTLGLDAGLAVRLGWMFFHRQDYYSSSSWFWWLAHVLWLLLLSIGLLALALVLENALRRQAGRALACLVLSVLALGSFAAASAPLFLLTADVPSVGDPPPGDYER